MSPSTTSKNTFAPALLSKSTNTTANKTVNTTTNTASTMAVTTKPIPPKITINYSLLKARKREGAPSVKDTTKKRETGNKAFSLNSERSKALTALVEKKTEKRKRDEEEGEDLECPATWGAVEAGRLRGGKQRKSEWEAYYPSPPLSSPTEELEEGEIRDMVNV